MEFLQSIEKYAFDLFVLIGVMFYRKELYTAIAGGNGQLQMDEIAKALILVVFYISARAERFREHEYQIYPEWYWVSLLGTVAIIAGIKAGTFKKLIGKHEKEQE